MKNLAEAYINNLQHRMVSGELRRDSDIIKEKVGRILMMEVMNKRAESKITSEAALPIIEGFFSITTHNEYEEFNLSTCKYGLDLRYMYSQAYAELEEEKYHKTLKYKIKKLLGLGREDK